MKTRELKCKHKKELLSLLEVSVLFLTPFLLKAHSHPEKNFSGAPLMPFVIFLSLLLHTLLSAFPCAFTLHLQCHLQPARREGGCDHNQFVSISCVSNSTGSTLSLFRSELSLTVSSGGGAFGGERMLLYSRLLDCSKYQLFSLLSL